MTSSLVGSEMCIRDSLYCPFLACLPLCPSLAFQREKERERERERERSVPVSYTHLTLPTICSV
eukprot:10302986-Prorocentrum_lima.AAC.1